MFLSRDNLFESIVAGLLGVLQVFELLKDVTVVTLGLEMYLQTNQCANNDTHDAPGHKILAATYLLCHLIDSP